MSVDPTFQLKQTNVSHPRLSHSNSLQSIAASQVASEGYYSLNSTSGSSSGDSDERSSKPTPGRAYHTPPSHNRTPAQSHEQLLSASDAAVTSLKGFGIPRQHNAAAAHQPRAVSTIAEERPDIQEGRSSNPRSAMGSESLATTPGMDETPYIRFAIDQLTRDEDVRGTRMYPLGPPPEEEEEDYPVERVVADDGLGYMKQEREKEKRMSRAHPPPPAPLPALPVQQQPQKQYQNQQKHPKPQQPLWRQQHAAAPTPSTPTKYSPPRKQSEDMFPTPMAQKDVFIAQSPPHAPLRFLPNILRPLSLVALFLLCLTMLAALIYSALRSNSNAGAGLWTYERFGDVRYFVFEYLPTMVGMVILMWLFQVEIALQRIVPFVSLASGSRQQRSQALFLNMFPMQFLFPKLEYFRAGQPLVGIFFVARWLFLWTIPLLASSFNVRYELAKQAWIWVAVQGVIWTVIALYIILVVALLGLIVFLFGRKTGLRWDPRSLADIMSLLERSNSMSDYGGSETFTKAQFKQRLGQRTDRIGYWSTTRRPNDTFYGLGEEGGATRRYSHETGHIREKGPESTQAHQSTQTSGDFSIRMDLRSPRVRLRYLPWYLRDTAVVAWIVTVISLFIALVAVSYVNSAVRLGFLPQVAARTNASGFSTSNFLYSFIPALIGLLLFLAILSLDYSLRALRPYISLSSPGGATAETSLLLDYSARLPLSATAAALENRHFQTAILSFVSLCSAAIPILAGGCFWTQYYPGSDRVRVSADLPAYYALCFFLGLYAISYLALLPGRRRAALPHRATTLAEIISWVYQSHILGDRAFARPQTKPELVTRLVGSAYVERTFAQSLTSLIMPSKSNLRLDTVGEKGKQKRAMQEPLQEMEEKRDSVLDPAQIRYGFGIHVGRDGLEHLGIDRVRRGGERSGRELVIWEEQRRPRSWGPERE
ncbi:hypothetical protein M011DRAFT_516435 [Sporormia fimetaria CBS 119925]|uniref:Uncharacterized protein n=1 Tax=Sporormia fimetaria CBS 119925 TaxID=1340428 RepID=A0A6A6VN66_9PLEO|nr:hypothetical protein M011DRAFT_516435 [Sporormia fimetaria CBS 119925]